MKRCVCVIRPGYFSLFLMPIGFSRLKIGLEKVEPKVNVHLCGCYPFDSGTIMKELYGESAHVGKISVLVASVIERQMLAQSFHSTRGCLVIATALVDRTSRENEENARDCTCMCKCSLDRK